MLHFCTWKDEDGSHYMIARKNPKSYFNWKGCHLCHPKTVVVNASILSTLVENPHPIKGDDFMEVDIKDWDMYFEDIRPKLCHLY